MPPIIVKFVGVSPDEKLVEMIEIEDHPWFLGCQFHPELKSRAVRAHPLFRQFIKAAKKYKSGSNGKKKIAGGKTQKSGSRKNKNVKKK